MATETKNPINIEGSMTGGVINAGDYASYTINQHYAEKVEALVEQLISPPVNAPSMSNAAFILKALANKHLVVLCAPDSWGLGTTWFSENLIYQGSKHLNLTEKFYKSYDRLGGSILVDYVEQKEIKDTIIYVTGVTLDQYQEDMLHRLTSLARQKNAYVILTSYESARRWPQGSWDTFDLGERSPFSKEDLAEWFCNAVNSPDPLNFEGIAKLRESSILPDGQLTPVTPLGIIKQTPCDFVETLKNSPYLVDLLIYRLMRFTPTHSAAVDSEHLKTLIHDLAVNVNKQLFKWFDELSEPERYLVLAISLAYDLPSQIFWAIYEQLTKRAWRERDISLRMTDYLDVRKNLKDFIEITAEHTGSKRSNTSGKIRFKNDNARINLVAYAMQGYSRSLIQALPVLAEIITGQLGFEDQQSVISRLRQLEIFGSDLSVDNVRQSNMQSQLISSIVQIYDYEPLTTEHLLLAWAEGTNISDRNLQQNTGFQLAFAQTILRMFQRETEYLDEPVWYERRKSFTLFYQWYNKYKYRGGRQVTFLSSQADFYQELRRANIRSSMTMAISWIAAETSMTPQVFGPAGDAWLNKIPEGIVAPESVYSLGTMLAAMVWDPMSQVRASVAGGLYPLFSNFPVYAEQLLEILATDWAYNVQIATASVLYDLVSDNEANLYLVNHLLDRSYSPLNRHITNREHYFYLQAQSREKEEYGLQLWTAGLAMLMIGQDKPHLLTIYLHTQLGLPESPHYKAFLNVLKFLISNGLSQKMFIHLLMDRTFDNRISNISLDLEKLLEDHKIGLSEFLSKEEIEDRQRLKKVMRIKSNN